MTDPNGLETTVLATTARRMTALLAREQVSARVPSLVAGVVRGGELAWAGSHGTPPAVGDEAASIDTQYRIGSITKVMTAILVMQLRDEGLVRLTDRLAEHLPGVAYGKGTLRELLSHSSGMQAEPPGPWWERSRGVTLASLVSRLDESDAPFAPGQEYHYSNLGYALLGEVVARTRAASWWSVLESRLLAPLGMRRTSYIAQQPAATGFSIDTFAGTLTEEPSHDSGAMAPAGQLWSTVEDLGRLAGFLADPDPSILRADSVAEMTTGQAGVPDGVNAGSYGLGLRLAVVADRSYIGHTGSVPGFLAGLFVDREHRTGAVCLANGADGVRAQDFPIDLLRLLEDLEPSIPSPWVPNTEVPPDVRDLLGLWYWGNMACTMSYEGDRVVVRLLRKALTWCTFRLDDTSRLVGATGYFAGEPLNAVHREDGSVGHLECATFIFTRVPYDPEAPVPGRGAEPNT